MSNIVGLDGKPINGSVLARKPDMVPERLRAASAQAEVSKAWSRLLKSCGPCSLGMLAEPGTLRVGLVFQRGGSIPLPLVTGEDMETMRPVLVEALKPVDDDGEGDDDGQG